MKIVVFSKENEIHMEYETKDSQISVKIDYNSIDSLIDYLMENEIKDAKAESETDDCSQYVTLINSILERIAEKDFVDCYNNTKKEDNK